MTHAAASAGDVWGKNNSYCSHEVEEMKCPKRAWGLLVVPDLLSFFHPPLVILVPHEVRKILRVKVARKSSVL